MSLKCAKTIWWWCFVLMVATMLALRLDTIFQQCCAKAAGSIMSWHKTSVGIELLLTLTWLIRSGGLAVIIQLRPPG